MDVPPISLPSPNEILATLRADRPRLICTQSDFDRVKQRIADPGGTSTTFFEMMRDRADAALEQPPAKREIRDGVRLLFVSREVKRMVFDLAAVYRLTGEAKYAERCWAELNAVCEFTDWNPPHFLDVAEMALSVAIGYDWLHDWLDEQQRKSIRDGLIKHALNFALAAYRSDGTPPHTWWTKTQYNWNQVCNGGLGVAALAIADTHPELASEIVHAGCRRLPEAMQHFEPDGAWIEGPGYWHYATEYGTYLIAALESSLGTDFGLSELSCYDTCADFPIYLCGPSDKSFNFADGKDRRMRAYQFFWFANRFNNPLYAWYARTYPKEHALDVMMFSEAGDEADLRAAPPDRKFSGVEVAAMRDGWAKDNGLFLAIKAGENGINHGQLDLGTFVIDALGERWVMDLGSDDYNVPGYFDRAGGRRWHFYRNRAEGHNTLIIDPDMTPDQTVDAKTVIGSFVSVADHASTTVDLTPAYPQAARIMRAYWLQRGTYALVHDEIELTGTHDLWWLVHTEANVELSDDGRSATLSIGEKQLRIALLEPPEARFSTMSARALPGTPTVDGEDANEGVTRLAIHLPSTSRTTIRVAFTPTNTVPTIVTPNSLTDWPKA